MARITKETEYNELAKFGECFKQTNNYGGYGIVVNDYGDAVLWRSYLTPSDSHTAQRWQEIKLTDPKDGSDPRAYFTIYGTRYYLDEFYRCAC